MVRKLLFFVFALFFAQLFFASSFGVTPAQKIVGYLPGTVSNLSFDIVNTEHKSLSLVILPQGELNRSIALSSFSEKIDASTDGKTIIYQFTVPSGLKPGRHSAEILVLEIPPEEARDSTFVGAVVGIITSVVIEVPYPGKYAEASLSIAPVKDGSISFVIPVLSKGDLNIVRAKALIDIYTPLNEKIVSLATDEIPVPSRERRELAVKWDTTGVSFGRYRAVANIVYDEEAVRVEKDFSVGEQVLEMKNVEVNDFTLGEIAKFEFLLENTWSEIITEAYIQMQVFNDEGAVMADFKSATYDIPSFENKLLVAFWDTDGVKKGDYDARAFVRFGAQSLQHDFKLEILDNEINVVGVGYVIKSGNGRSGGSNSLVVVLATAVGILVLLNVIWFLVLRKKLTGKSSQK